MASNEPAYRLVVFDAPDDPQATRDLVAKVVNMHPTDAMRWVARTPGVFPGLLTEGQVRPLLDGLYDLGVAAEAWRDDSFPDLTRPRVVHEAACLPEGFRITGLRGEPTHWIPWDQIELVNAGRVVDDENRDSDSPRWTSPIVMGLQVLVKRPGSGNRSNRVPRTPRDPVGEIHIVRDNPRLAFRIIANQMNYASLGERLKPSAAENFPIFLAAIVAQADRAHITHSTRLLMIDSLNPETKEDLAPKPYDFDSSRAMIDDTTLKLLWSWYRRDRDSQASTMS
jgi:hypothetical protein